MFFHALLATRIAMRIEEIELAPGFVREVVAAWEAWDGKENAPMKLRQLMLNLRIDVYRLYKIGVRPQEKPKIPVYTDTRLI
jgi:hypothetical protein